MCILPSSSTGDVVGATLIAAGTKSGHVRKYDTRQRNYVHDWKVAREGGIVTLEAGQNEQYVVRYFCCALQNAYLYAVSTSELFFVDASSQFGSMDIRTGRTLYTYSKQTATAYDVLPLPHAGPVSGAGQRVGMLSLSSDATVRIHSISAPPKEAKGNVPKGEILGMIGGVGIGKMAYCGMTDIPREEDEGREGEEDSDEEADDGEENVWDDLAVVQGDDEEEDSESEDDEEELREARKKTDGKRMDDKAPPRKRTR